MYIQCNLDLMTMNLVTTCNLVAILQKTIYNLQLEIIVTMICRKVASSRLSRLVVHLRIFRLFTKGKFLQDLFKYSISNVYKVWSINM